jgi:hypothetical protein
MVPSNTTKRFTSAVFMAATTWGAKATKVLTAAERNPQIWMEPSDLCWN